LRARRLESLKLHRFWNSLKQRKVSLLTLALLPAVVALTVAGCGSASTGAGSGASARKLLSETFSGRHTITSGVLGASLTVTPSGSSDFTHPISLDFSGPFESRGAGKLPESDFNIAIHFDGQTGQLSFLSTGTAGYVILDDTAYKLPASSFKKLESGLGNVGGSGGSSSSTPGGLSLSSLGIHPERWLADPEVAGTAEVGGAQTNHITGTIALGPLLKDLSTILAKASTVSSAASGTLKAISTTERSKIEGEIRNATFGLWTGTSDHTIRKLDVSATLPVSGALSTQLGGLSSAKLAIAFGYSDIGQAQTITAPATSKPYSQFQTKITELIGEIEQLAESDASSGSNSASG
jgi:hypothetical protein